MHKAQSAVLRSVIFVYLNSCKRFTVNLPPETLQAARRTMRGEQKRMTKLYVPWSSMAGFAGHHFTIVHGFVAVQEVEKGSRIPSFDMPCHHFSVTSLL